MLVLFRTPETSCYYLLGVQIDNTTVGLSGIIIDSNANKQIIQHIKFQHRESTDVTLNWKMLILMMRLAKLARQPTAVIQERLGTTKYQIQVNIHPFRV